ncbi:MAG TPA: polysaccharide biosynthesis C-terminal domain-containing protein [Hanamia sp.]
MANTVSLIFKADKTRKIVWLFLSKVMPLVALFFITIIYSRKLTYDDYGKFQSVWIYTNIVNVIISFGIASVILSTELDFLRAFIKKNRKKLSLYYSILWISGLIAFFFAAKNFNTSLKFLLIAFIIIQNVASAADNLLIKIGSEKTSGVINFFYASIFFGWHIYVLHTGYSLYHLIAGIAIISIVRLIIILLISFQKREITVTNENNHNFLYHWGYLGLNDALGVLARWIDKLFLLYLLSSTDFAVFFNGSIEIPLFALLVSVTGNFLAIEISANIQHPEKVIKVYSASFHILSNIVFPLFLFLLFFRVDLFSLAFNHKYDASLPIFIISIFILPLRINNYGVILQCYSQGKRVLYGSLLDLFIAITLMFILYPLMGTKGVAISIVISTYCQSFYYLWYSSTVLNSTILHLLPLKKLGVRFLKILALYLVLSFSLSSLSAPARLIFAITITAAIVFLGMIKYSKTYFNKP